METETLLETSCSKLINNGFVSLKPEEARQILGGTEKRLTDKALKRLAKIFKNHCDYITQFGRKIQVIYYNHTRDTRFQGQSRKFHVQYDSVLVVLKTTLHCKAVSIKLQSTKINTP